MYIAIVLNSTKYNLWLGKGLSESPAAPTTSTLDTLATERLLSSWERPLSGISYDLTDAEDLAVFGSDDDACELAEGGRLVGRRLKQSNT